jgi:3-oxoacyl-[acyl-carrier-protein] synthase III
VDTYIESVGVGIEPSMKMPVGTSHWNLSEIYDQGLHHLTQDLGTVMRLAPDLGLKGFRTMLDKTGLDLSSVRCFFLNIPTKHLMDLAIEIWNKDFQMTNLPFYTRMSTKGYQGAPAIIIALDDFMKEAELDSGDQLASFVTESSKWMHAGFILEYCGGA